MAALNLLKTVADRHKSAVFGYIRQKEAQLLLRNIPSMIAYLCLQFYFHGEYFEKCSDDLEISPDKKTVTKIQNGLTWNNLAYGKVWINSISNCIAKWKFKIDYLHRSTYWQHFVIYFLSKEHDPGHSAMYVRDPERPFYVICGNGCCYSHESMDSSQPIAKLDAFTINDEIILTLNTIQKTIWMQVNGRQNQCLFVNITSNEAIKYKVGIMLFDLKYSISLIDFDCVQY